VAPSVRRRSAQYRAGRRSSRQPTGPLPGVSAASAPGPRSFLHHRV